MISRHSHLFTSWFLLTLFFISHYLIRVSPALLSLDFIKDFNIFPSKVGLISSSYFLIYTLAQLPAAYLLKYFSPKHVVTIAAICCGLCTIGIALTSSFSALLCYYLLLAFFSSCAFICSVTFASRQLSESESILLSITPALGMAAGFTATNCLSTALSLYQWREVLLFSSSIFFITALLVALFSITGTLPKAALEDAEKSCDSVVFCSAQTWLNALFIGTSYFPVMLIIEGGVGPSLLRSIHVSCTPGEISFGISLVFIGWMITGPFSGLFIKRFGPLFAMSGAALSGALLSCIILYVPLSPKALYLTLFLFGATNTGILGALSLAAQMHGKQHTALSIAIASMAMTLVGGILCGILPSLLELSYQPIWDNGVPLYSASAYRSVFSCMISIPLFSMLCLIFIKKVPS